MVAFAVASRGAGAFADTIANGGLLGLMDLWRGQGMQRLRPRVSGAEFYGTRYIGSIKAVGARR